MYVFIFGTNVEALIKVFKGAKTKGTLLYLCMFGTNVFMI